MTLLTRCKYSTSSSPFLGPSLMLSYAFLDLSLSLSYPSPKASIAICVFEENTLTSFAASSRSFMFCVKPSGSSPNNPLWKKELSLPLMYCFASAAESIKAFSLSFASLIASSTLFKLTLPISIGTESLRLLNSV